MTDVHNGILLLCNVHLHWTRTSSGGGGTGSQTTGWRTVVPRPPLTEPFLTNWILSKAYTCCVYPLILPTVQYVLVLTWKCLNCIGRGNETKEEGANRTGQKWKWHRGSIQLTSLQLDGGEVHWLWTPVRLHRLPSEFSSFDSSLDSKLTATGCIDDIDAANLAYRIHWESRTAECPDAIHARLK